MTCQSSGRSPTMAIGLGPLETPSRIRIPRPPQNRTTFMATPPGSRYVKLGDRENQPAAPGPDVAKLLRDLLPEVPGQDENVVGFGLRQPLGRVDGDMGAGQELALLHRAPVNGVGQQVGPDAAVVQQGVALARGAVAGHRLALRRGRQQEAEQVALDLEYRCGEA